MRFPCTGRPCNQARSGFSIIEAVMVLLVVAVVVGTLTPKMQTLLMQSRVDRASGLCASDMYLAQSLASRARQPVRFTVDATAKTITLKLPNDSILVTRHYGAEGEWKVGSLTASPGEVIVLPNGMANVSMTVSLAYQTHTRQVRLSRSGQIRIID